MAKKNYWNGIILGVVLAILALAASQTMSMIEWVDTLLIGPLTNFLANASWMPEFFTTLTWFNYLVAGLIGALIGFYIEVK